MEQTDRLEGTPRTDQEKWRAVEARDERFDGAFVFGVRSTGIYCRPSCPARRPQHGQVVFFANPEDAEQNGFRPCKRCRPKEGKDSPKKQLASRACAYIESHATDKLTLSLLGSHLGVSPHHLQRTFKQVVGISPREYVDACRVAKLKKELRVGKPVTKAAYNAGFSSRSRLYDRVPSKFGMTPGIYRKGGQGTRINYTIATSPVGRLLLAATELGVCAVCLGNSDADVENALMREYPLAEVRRNDAALSNWVTELKQFLSGDGRDLDLPLDVRGTAFQWRVWKEIQSIPYGRTSSYDKIARSIGAPSATRAVARACATNPVALIIPCHRVVRKDTKLGGYRWGITRKQALLTLEQSR